MNVQSKHNASNDYTTIAVLSIVVGMVALLENFGIIQGFSKLWPLLVLILGSGMLLLYKTRRYGNLALLGIGFFLIEISFLFLFCSFVSWNFLSSFGPFLSLFLEFQR